MGANPTHLFLQLVRFPRHAGHWTGRGDEAHRLAAPGQQRVEVHPTSFDLQFRRQQKRELRLPAQVLQLPVNGCAVGLLHRFDHPHRKVVMRQRGRLVFFGPFRFPGRQLHADHDQTLDAPDLNRVIDDPDPVVGLLLGVWRKNRRTGRFFS